MAKKTGLGKGLDALFASTIEEEKKEEEIQAGEKIHKLKLIENFSACLDFLLFQFCSKLYSACK